MAVPKAHWRNGQQYWQQAFRPLLPDVFYNPRVQQFDGFKNITERTACV
jgi:hypothetical protein